jgi:hypothetical protein
MVNRLSVFPGPLVLKTGLACMHELRLPFAATPTLLTLDSRSAQPLNSAEMCSLAQQSGRWKNTMSRGKTEHSGGSWSPVSNYFGGFAIGMDTRKHC